jgi:photosystem II stability/assembly factor-like uncharacterized protein
LASERAPRRRGLPLGVSADVGTWVSVGPTMMGPAAAGVLFSIAIDAADRGMIYVSSPFCGVWKTPDSGASWLSVGDEIPDGLAVAAVAADPSTPGRVYALLQAGQVYRSDDGAASWALTGPGVPGPVPAVTDLIVDPSQPSVLHLRGTTACWRSDDGGQSWQQTKLGSATGLALDVTQPDVLYAGIPGDGVYQTLDGGVSGDAGWTNLTTPGGSINSLALLNVYDIQVALTAADPMTLYARFQRHLEADVYRSLDGGASWELRSSPAIYSSLIGADDTQPATVYIAGVDFYRSDDGGQTWTLKPGAHVDHHYLATDPEDSATIYTGCDGGIYRSADRADSWQFIGDGLTNGLFYDLALAATDPEVTIGGTQDNGTQLYNGTSTRWQGIFGGDGATVAIDPADAAVMYAMNQYASSIAQSTNGGSSFQNIAAGLPSGAVCYNLHFQVHPTTPGILLASCGSLWWTQQAGTPWSALFTPPGAPMSDSVLRSAVDPSTNIYYAATVRGELYAAVGGLDWQLVFTHPSGAAFVDLVIDPDDTPHAYAAFDCAGAEKVYRLRRSAFPPAPLEATAIGAGLADTCSVRTLAVDAMRPFTIYAGTTAGVFQARSSSAEDQPVWSSYSDGMPPADVRALRVHPATGVMRAATYGRSVYEVNTDDPVGSLVEAEGHISFLRAHDLGTGYGKPPNFLDCEVIVLLAEQPNLAFGFQLRADAEEPTRQEMFDLLRAAFVASRTVRVDYVKTGPRVGEIIRVANP